MTPPGGPFSGTVVKLCQLQTIFFGNQCVGNLSELPHPPSIINWIQHQMWSSACPVSRWERKREGQFVHCCAASCHLWFVNFDLSFYQGGKAWKGKVWEVINKKHRHRRNVTSHHFFDNFHSFDNFHFFDYFQFFDYFHFFDYFTSLTIFTSLAIFTVFWVKKVFGAKKVF